MRDGITQDNPKPRRLHIGCGKVYLPTSEGWINHDLFSSVQADVYADMSALPFVPNTFDLIYASHVLEHCHRHCILATLSHWRDLLKPGGTLRLAVPNFEAVCRWYQKTGDLRSVLGLLYGGQNHPKNSHTIAFDETALSRDLLQIGMVDVKWWDWRKTEHVSWDDYSQCFLPHMQKDNPEAMLMSLNLEAKKP